MPRTAFLILKSPHEQDPTRTMARLAERNDAVAILVEDGVYQALLPEPAERLTRATCEVLVSREDLDARGFAPAELKVGRPVEYAEMVEYIMERTDRTVTV